MLALSQADTSSGRLQQLSLMNRLSCLWDGNSLPRTLKLIQ